MEPYMTSFGIPIIAKFENCESIEEVEKEFPKKVAKLLKEGLLPSITDQI